MKPINDAVMDKFEDVAIKGAEQIHAFFTYQGDNPRYFQKAKLGAVAISGYGKLRASETNRMQIEQIAKKQGAK